MSNMVWYIGWDLVYLRTFMLKAANLVTMVIGNGEIGNGKEDILMHGVRSMCVFKYTYVLYIYIYIHACTYVITYVHRHVFHLRRYRSRLTCWRYMWR